MKNRTFFTPFFTFAIFAFLSFASSATALACPAALEGMRTRYLGGKTVCEVADRYSKVKAELSALGLAPDRIVDAIAPRFIHPRDWARLRAERDYDPWKIYEPAPETWRDWERARLEVDTAAAKNLANGAAPRISLDWMKSLHSFATKNELARLAGKFRGVDVFGYSLDRSTALPVAAIQELERTGYRNRKGKTLIRWKSTLCYDEVDSSYRPNADGSEITQDEIERQYRTIEGYRPRTFLDAKGVERQCGYARYAQVRDIRSELESWERDLNARAAAASSDPNVDPVLTAARAQKWFVTIHPFYDGNGRLSRFAMDYFLQSVGLPPALLAEPDDDLFASEEEWAIQVGSGVERVLGILESCVREPSRPGCRVSSTIENR